MRYLIILRQIWVSPLLCCINFGIRACAMHQYCGSLLSLLKKVFISQNEPDRRVWCPHFLGVFLPSLSFQSLLKKHHHPIRFLSERYGNPWLPLRSKFLLWVETHCRINTMVLQRRRPFKALPPHVCFLYEADGESCDHIFLQCMFMIKIWNNFTSSFDYAWVMMARIIDMIVQWGGDSLWARGKIFLESLINGMLWEIWK